MPHNIKMDPSTYIMLVRRINDVITCTCSHYRKTSATYQGGIEGSLKAGFDAGTRTVLNIFMDSYGKEMV